MVNDFRSYLSHHGIEGQKWGKRNGPPYPLTEGDYSSAEKEKLNKHKNKEIKILNNNIDKYNKTIDKYNKKMNNTKSKIQKEFLKRSINNNIFYKKIAEKELENIGNMYYSQLKNDKTNSGKIVAKEALMSIGTYMVTAMIPGSQTAMISVPLPQDIANKKSINRLNEKEFKKIYNEVYKDNIKAHPEYYDYKKEYESRKKSGWLSSFK